MKDFGCTSIVELLDAVITKFQSNLVREYADLLFVAFAMVVANDNSAKCREIGHGARPVDLEPFQEIG